MEVLNEILKIKVELMKKMNEINEILIDLEERIQKLEVEIDF
jgi:hypothetical protein